MCRQPCPPKQHSTTLDLAKSSSVTLFFLLLPLVGSTHGKTLRTHKKADPSKDQDLPDCLSSVVLADSSLVDDQPQLPVSTIVPLPKSSSHHGGPWRW